MDSLQLLALMLALSLNPANPSAAPPTARAAKDAAMAVASAAKMPLTFAARDRAVIEDYYRADALSGTQGAKGASDRDHELALNARLPVGSQKQPLPADLAQKLTRIPRGYERAVVGHDIVLIDTSTHKVVDIIRGAA